MGVAWRDLLSAMSLLKPSLRQRMWMGSFRQQPLTSLLSKEAKITKTNRDTAAGGTERRRGASFSSEHMVPNFLPCHVLLPQLPPAPCLPSPAPS